MDNLYIDCGMGVSAVKLFGALVDLLEKPETFVRNFNNIGLEGIRLGRKISVSGGVSGTKLEFTRVSSSGYDEDEYDDDEHHSHRSSDDEESTHESRSTVRTLGEVEDIINDLSLSGTIRKRAIGVYRAIAAAQSEANGLDIETLKLHRTGPRDVIASVVGVCMIIEDLKPKMVASSRIAVGSGHTVTVKGKTSIPTPAMKLLLGDMPYTSGSEPGELSTLDGIALVREYATSFSKVSDFAVIRSGVGLGTRSFKHGMNCTKVFLGRVSASAANATVAELTAELFSDTDAALILLGQRLDEAGALSAYTTPISRLGGGGGAMILKCICPMEKADKIASEVIRNTSATLVSRSNLAAYQLETVHETMQTSLGEIRYHRTTGFDIDKIVLDSDDIIRAARENGLSIQQVQDIIMSEK